MQGDDRWDVLRATLVVMTVAVVLAAAVMGARYLRRGPFASPNQLGVTPVSDETCTVAIGQAGEEVPTGTAVELQSGQAVTVLVACPVGITVVDLVVSLPPPDGLMQITAAWPGSMTDGWQTWNWEGQVDESLVGAQITMYAYADGRPVGAPVTLTVIVPVGET